MINPVMFGALQELFIVNYCLPSTCTPSNSLFTDLHWPPCITFYVSVQSGSMLNATCVIAALHSGPLRLLQREKLASPPLMWCGFSLCKHRMSAHNRKYRDVILLKYVSNCVVNESKWYLVCFCLLIHRKKKKNRNQVFSRNEEWMKSVCFTFFSQCK